MPERRKLAQGRRRHRAKSRCCCFFSVSIFFFSFPGRKGAGSGGEENSSYRLKVFLLCLDRLRDFSCEASLFRTHTPAHSLSYSRHLESHQKIHHLTYCFTYLIGTRNVRPAGNGSNHTFKMYLCTFIRIKANAGKGGTSLGYDGI